MGGFNDKTIQKCFSEITKTVIYMQNETLAKIPWFKSIY
jgi:hypothetical protein